MHPLYEKIDWQTMEKEIQRGQKMLSGKMIDDRHVEITEIRHHGKSAIQIRVDGVSVFEAPSFTYLCPPLSEIKTFLEFWEPGMAPR